MSTPKHILILTADAGFGHRAAANAVAQALATRYPDECRVTVVNPLDDKRAPAILRRAQDDYDRMIQSTPELYKFGYEASDGSFTVSIAEQGLIAMLYLTMRDVVQQHKPDAIVTTYPLFQAPLAALFALNRQYIPVLTVVTDLVSVHSLWFNEDIDRCLVPTEAVRQKALESGLPPEHIEVTGLPVNPVFGSNPDKAELRRRLGWSEDRCVALMAGSKRVKKLEPLAHVLNHSGLPLELAIVAGGDKELHSRLSEVEWHLPAHVYGFVDDMPALMLAADFIVCKAGGLIVSEALAAGLPLLLVEAIPGQETGNAEYVERGGAGVLVEDAVAGLTTIYHWLMHDRAELHQRAERACTLGKPQAAMRVAELALAAANEGAERRVRRLGTETTLLNKLLSGLDLDLG